MKKSPNFCQKRSDRTVIAAISLSICVAPVFPTQPRCVLMDVSPQWSSSYLCPPLTTWLAPYWSYMMLLFICSTICLCWSSHSATIPQHTQRRNILGRIPIGSHYLAHRSGWFLPNTTKRKGLSFQQDPPRRARIFTQLCLESYGDVSTIDHLGCALPSLTLPLPPLSPECEMPRGLIGCCILQ